MTPKVAVASASQSAVGIERHTAAKVEHSAEFALAARIEAMRNLAVVERQIVAMTHWEARKTLTGVVPTLQSSFEPPSVATRLDPLSADAQLCSPSTGAIPALPARLFEPQIPQPA